MDTDTRILKKMEASRQDKLAQHPGVVTSDEALDEVDMEINQVIRVFVEGRR